jgi:primosomal replication protein N
MNDSHQEVSATAADILKGVNRTEISGRIVERSAMRWTPAGLPALDLKLGHESMQVEAGIQRRVQALVKAKAIGVVAQRLDTQDIGSLWRFSGFLASPGNPFADTTRAKSVAFHIIDFQPI